MSESEPRLPLGEALHAAYGAETGCPPPEAYLELAASELPQGGGRSMPAASSGGGAPAASGGLPMRDAASGGLSEPERRRLAEHADRCPACAAERELARAFAAPPQTAGEAAGGEDVAYVVARLEAMDLPRRGAPRSVPPIYKEGEAPVATPRAVAPPRSASEPVQPRQPWSTRETRGTESTRSRSTRSTRRMPPALRMALAATLAASIGWAVYLSRAPEPPALPEAPTTGAVRGAEIEGLAPQGEVAGIPAALAWEPVPGARAYRVTLRGVDEAVLWQGTVAAPPAVLPADLRSRLHPAVVYVWSVQALGEGEETLAASPRARFRARPSPG